MWPSGPVCFQAACGTVQQELQTPQYQIRAFLDFVPGGLQRDIPKFASMPQKLLPRNTALGLWEPDHHTVGFLCRQLLLQQLIYIQHKISCHY